MNKLFGSVFSLFTFAFASLAFVQNANAGLVFGDGTAQIAYGQQYENSVMSFQVQDDLGIWKPFGSAVVIGRAANGEIAFLAADHSIIKNSGNPTTRFSDYRVGVNNYFTGNTQQVTDFVLHPNALGQINGFSYGLGFLSASSFTADLAPVSFYNGTVMVGQDSDIAGYGNLIDIRNVSNETFTGDLRAGNNVISDLGFLHPNYLATKFEPDGRPNYRPLGMGGRSGDSGGGLFINGELAGITTFGSVNAGFSTRTAYNILDQDWVNTVIAGRSTAVPEPSSFLMFALGSACLGLLRRKRGTT